MRTLTLLSLGFFCLASFAFAEEPAKVRRVLYVGIDGTRFDALEKAATPNLDRLMKNGSFTKTCLVLGERYRKNDTVSGPGWSTIYTGVWADKHGVQDNSFKGANYKDYPHFFARIRAAEPQARLVSFVTWKPIQEKIVSAANVNEVWEDSTRVWHTFDEGCTAAVVKELQEQNPLAVAYYLGNVDETGHKFGFHPSVPQYVAAIEKADHHLGEVLTALEARENYEKEDWLVVVTTDHGGKGTGNGGGHNTPEILNGFLIVSGDAAEKGEFKEQIYLVDAVPTLLTFLGIKPDDAWKLDGRAVGLKK